MAYTILTLGRFEDIKWSGFTTDTVFINHSFRELKGEVTSQLAAAAALDSAR